MTAVKAERPLPAARATGAIRHLHPYGSIHVSSILRTLKAGGLSWLEVTQPYTTSNSYADFLPSQPPARFRLVKSAERQTAVQILTDRINTWRASVRRSLVTTRYNMPERGGGVGY